MAKKAQAINESRRYELLPQMRAYDEMQSEWMAYVMFINRTNYRSSYCNTDQHGFRHTWSPEGVLDYSAMQNLGGERGYFLGGSTIFGVGATDDSKTIPSLLNQNSGTTWYNLGGRAFNSTQELLLYEFFLPEAQKIVLFSGLNNLVAHLGSTYFTHPYGAFCDESLFYRPSKRSIADHLRQYVPQWVKQRALQSSFFSQPVELEHRYNESLNILERDLDIWRILQDSKQFTLWYVLQPNPYWAQKRLCPEEEELFAILDHQQGPRWRTMSQRIADTYQQYATDLEDICGARNIRFIDCNKLLPGEGWLFCDRAHLTDDGYKAMATALKGLLD
jgi:hypothetical protein